MFTFAQPAYHHYNPYQELAVQQELQRRRHIEAYLRRQQEAEEIERRRREYEAAVRRAEYERRQQAELQRRRQAQQARARHSMYDGGLEALFEALYGGQGHRQEDGHTSVPLRTSPRPTTTPTDAPAPSPMPSPTAAELEPMPQTESEPEPEPEESQVNTAPSHAAIQSILSSFSILQSEFAFPTQLDFLPGTSAKLAYTPNNAPLHGYEHALTGLLTKLDAVESYGDGEVRRTRKEAVKTIERELERLDGMKVDVWNRVNVPQAEAEVSTKESGKTEVATAEVDPLSVPLPEDMDVEADTPEATESEEALVADQGATLTVSDSTPSMQAEVASPLDIEQSVGAVAEPAANPVPVSIPHITDTEHVVLPEAPNCTTASVLSYHIPDSEPLTRSLGSPSPPEASDCNSDVELEEYVDVETLSKSEDEGDEMQEVEKDGDLELMREWELDF
ncbi:unnamed protein product [Rhizoctonia solani]|uniref:BAG domain-containing protein n=1 Tax=Rhizoctonia solani TaxID=456999 RepID=A0A8H3GV39_9AGAM|nr:unnamed protein product [Rhizoctonia solani]